MDFDSPIIVLMQINLALFTVYLHIEFFLEYEDAAVTRW